MSTNWEARRKRWAEYKKANPMKTFQVKNVSGGHAFWHAMPIKAKDLQDLARQLSARVVNSCPGWAFLQAGETTSFEVTWR